MTNEELAKELFQDHIDVCRDAGLTDEDLVSALTAHAEHLRGGATTPLIKTTVYLDNKVAEG